MQSGAVVTEGGFRRLEGLWVSDGRRSAESPSLRRSVGHQRRPSASYRQFFSVACLRCSAMGELLPDEFVSGKLSSYQLASVYFASFILWSSNVFAWNLCLLFLRIISPLIFSEKWLLSQQAFSDRIKNRKLEKLPVISTRKRWAPWRLLGVDGLMEE